LEVSKLKFHHFAIAWGLLFFLQGWWTPPHIDELYYWRFSQELDWGFFDHPPMVALLIKISDTLFNGGLAIRACTVLMTVASLWIIFKQIDSAMKTSLFWSLVFILPFLHLYGFITTPDVPLLFFGALFLYFYKRITENDLWSDYLLWGVVMGLMLYSKYHGALLIIFTLISNPRLFLKPKTYIAGAIGLLVWVPHIWWQYEHNWMTFRYHLSERTGNYEWFFPLEYLGNMVLFFNPLLIGFLIRTVRNKWQNQYEKALYFVFIGFLGFFAFQSFRDHVQPQWLILTYIPFIVLLINHFKDSDRKIFRKLVFLSVPIMIAAHIFLSFDLLKSDGGIFRKEQFVQKIEEIAGNRPVVFVDSYQDPSIYKWFKPNSISHSFNRDFKRKNQFNIWMQDTMMNGEEVFVYALDRFKIPDYVTYRSFDKIKVSMEEDSTLTIKNPYDYPVEFSEQKHQIIALFYKKKRVVKRIPIDLKQEEIIAAESEKNSGFKFDAPGGFEYDAVGFSVKVDPWPGTSVYHRYKISK